MSIPCYTQNDAKILFIYSNDSLERCQFVYECNQHFIRINTLNTSDPRSYYFIEDDFFWETPKMIPDFLQRQIDRYDQIFVFLSPLLTCHRLTSLLITTALSANKVTAIGLGLAINDDWRRLPDGKLAEITPLEIYRNDVVQLPPWGLMIAAIFDYGHIPLTAQEIEFLDD